MTKKTPTKSRIFEAVHETASDLHRLGFIDKRKMQKYDVLCLEPVQCYDAARVATSQTNEAKRAAEARKQSEQAVSQAAQLEAQSREAYRRQEYQQANDLMRQADQLRAELAQKARDADAQAVQSKQGVREAIDRIRQSEDILNQALDAESKAHQKAARSALTARDEIQRTLTETTRQIDDITAKLKDGMKLTLDADTTRFNKALADLDKALAEKEYTSWLRWKYGASVGLTMKSDAMRYWGQLAQQDRRKLEEFIDRKTLTGNESQSLQRIKQRWRQAMAQPLLWGKDLERELIDYMEQNHGQFYRLGGLSRSDTVPAMLTPGEYVVRRDVVARLGVGFFEAINNLTAPAQALAGRTLASVQGFASGGLVQAMGANVPRPALTDTSAPTRTVRVELAAGGRQVTATVDGRDEARLLQLLDAARARTT
ncbi:hypothetical protein EBQ24_12230 [Allofranklinella schreckenbergeri]|uniref:Uncharacterized protein n=1 Tax=Allofranklinella schreckenbergeri TaxID=1076744 RepID=A0A3M6QQK9_9BURK|nr:hypothetical protein [Allofranklinella schreckenbergeri]RMX04742.1 hypothetical protein EBQ24_12230 [Allofranklinella schreckenbergeri]